MSDLVMTLDDMRAACWAMLARGVAKASSPARRPVLASVGLDGGAEARIVVLRALDTQAGTLDLHTDAASPKVAEIRANPLATLLFWDSEIQLQLRINVRITVLGGADTAAAWAEIPHTARANYGATPAPGQPLRTPEDLVKAPQPDRFAILRATIRRIDALSLAYDSHRRAKFQVEDAFTGLWVAP